MPVVGVLWLLTGEQVHQMRWWRCLMMRLLGEQDHWMIGFCCLTCPSRGRLLVREVGGRNCTYLLYYLELFLIVWIHCHCHCRCHHRCRCSLLRTKAAAFCALEKSDGDAELRSHPDALILNCERSEVGLSWNVSATAKHQYLILSIYYYKKDGGIR